MGDGRRWGLVAGALLVLVGRLGFMLVSTTLRLTLLTRAPSHWVFETARELRGSQGTGHCCFKRSG